MFTKGQLVTVITSWNNQGTFSITQAEVYSCGKKQMVINARGNPDVCLGRNFYPRVQQANNESGLGFNCQFVFPAMTNEEAEAKALELGAAMIAYEIDRLNGHIARQPNASKGYLDSLRKDIAELEASTPAFIHRDR